MPPTRSRVPARRPRFLAPIFLSLVVLMACTHGGVPEPPDPHPAHAGGTLELSMVRGDFLSQFPGDPAVNLDPARDHTRTGMELLRCCLARTLLMPDDRPGHTGGLVPDLAATMPVVSADGLTWTFRLRSGLTYAPPLEHTPIVAADIRRALTRVALLGDAAAYAYEFSPIEGFDAVVQGIASSITGWISRRTNAPDPSDGADRRSRVPARASRRRSAAPVIERDRDDGDRDGSRSGLRRLPRVVRPVHVPGCGRPDLEWRPTDRPRGSGRYHARPESFVAPGDRPDPGAYPNQIDISTTAEQPSENAPLVGEGSLDFQFEERSTTSQADFDASTGDPAAATRSFQWPLDDTWVIAMNVAVPPFDDLFIRRAVGLAFDTTSAIAMVHAGDVASTGWYSTGDQLVHVAPDDLEGDRLVNFDPFLGRQGADRRARADIAIGKSSYEHQKDGDCTDPLCRGITIAVYDQPPFPDIADSLRRDLSAVGIKLQDANVPYADAYDPASHVGIVIGPPWSTDYPNASRSFVPMTGAMIAAVGNHNFSLAGASSTQLSDFGYPAGATPTIDDRFGFCAPLTLEEQVSCWTLLDKYTMTEVVPWVPYLSTTLIWTASSRVHGIVQDPFSKMVALDQVWLSDVTPSSG